jgi:hypothetical protein
MPTAPAELTGQLALRCPLSGLPLTQNNEKSQLITLYNNKITIISSEFSSQHPDGTRVGEVSTINHLAKIGFRYFHRVNQPPSLDPHPALFDNYRLILNYSYSLNSFTLELRETLSSLIASAVSGEIAGRKFRATQRRPPLTDAEWQAPPSGIRKKATTSQS